MIVVHVDLHSAITEDITELARMEIINDGSSDSPARGNYACRTLIGRNKDALDNRTVARRSCVENYPRLRVHVWNLVARALANMKYDK